MSEKDIVEEARGLLGCYPEGKVFVPNSRDLDRMPELLRALADEVERLRGVDGELDDIRECDKCDLCEDHHG